MPQSKHFAKALTNIRHFGSRGRQVRKKKDNCSELLTHIVLIEKKNLGKPGKVISMRAD